MLRSYDLRPLKIATKTEMRREGLSLRQLARRMGQSYGATARALDVTKETGMTIQHLAAIMARYGWVVMSPTREVLWDPGYERGKPSTIDEKHDDGNYEAPLTAADQALMDEAASGIFDGYSQADIGEFVDACDEESTDG